MTLAKKVWLFQWFAMLLHLPNLTARNAAQPDMSVEFFELLPTRLT